MVMCNTHDSWYCFSLLLVLFRKSGEFPSDTAEPPRTKSLGESLHPPARTFARRGGGPGRCPASSPRRARERESGGWGLPILLAPEPPEQSKAKRERERHIIYLIYMYMQTKVQRIILINIYTCVTRSKNEISQVEGKILHFKRMALIIETYEGEILCFI